MAKIDFTYNMYSPSQAVDLGFAREYFDTLPEADRNRKYFNGEVYNLSTNFLTRQLNFFSLAYKLNTLQKFYPHQRQIKKTVEQMEEDRMDYAKNVLIFTGLSWSFLYQFARKGQVLPILKEYGTYLQSHRLFRQYAYTLIFPSLFAIHSYFNKYNDHVEILWKTHSNRLNNHLLSDPARTDIPEDIRRPLRRINENAYYN